MAVVIGQPVISYDTGLDKFLDKIIPFDTGQMRLELVFIFDPVNTAGANPLVRF
jgi:hypothetical protein